MRVHSDSFQVPGAPKIEGLAFRPYRGPHDHRHIVDIYEAGRKSEGGEWPTTLEDVNTQYRHLKNCDPLQDAYFAEIDGVPIGYSRVSWDRLLEGIYVGRLFVTMLPEWRGQGIRVAMLRESERRIAATLGKQPDDGRRYYEAWADEREVDWERLLKAGGYAPERYFYSMRRPSLEGIPDLPLPEGIEVRPVPPAKYKQLWDAMVEAFRDHWGAEELNEDSFLHWQESPYFQPDLWQVAWDGDEIVGQVLNFINENENAENGWKRGYTEDISVRRPWRRRGIARALIARSLALLKAQGMEEASLGVDTENPSGALGLYEGLGFERSHKETCYRKPVGL